MTPRAPALLIRTSTLLVVFAIGLLAFASPALATDTTTRSAADVHVRWLQLKPVYSGSPYVVAPTLTSPYAAGSLTSGFLQDGLNSINYARFLAGLPDDVVADPTYTSNAQHGAVLLAVGQFAHSQAQPAGMATDFYTIANGATSSSNIGWGYSSLWDFNISCMGDADTTNIDRIGHRRWILNPPLLKTGMGMANNRTDTWVFDWSRSAVVTYDSEKWPAAGVFPAEMFATDVPWSITLNPSLYSWTSGTAGHTVTLVRERDGKTWTFTSADTDKSGQYFNFETSGYGVANCFIFRPAPSSVDSYQNGDVFDVTLSGGITKKSDGSAATIAYRTQFISQEDTSAPSLPPTPTPTPGQTFSTTTRLAGASSSKVRRTLKLTGSIAPAGAAGRVTIVRSRRVSGKWKRIGSAKVSAVGGKFAYRFTPGARGCWSFVATYSGGTVGSASYRGSKSAAKGVRVK